MIALFVRLYFLMKRLQEHLSYALTKPAKRKVIVLTFDDHVDEKSVELAKYLESRRITATFFLTLNDTKPEVIRKLVLMSHEIGGHSLSHSREERKGKYATALGCYSQLRKYDSDVTSWRFPWTSKDEECVRNVAEAGFKIDSSVGTFLPVKRLKKFMGLYEIPWLRLPKKWQMDFNEREYRIIKDHIIKMVSSKNGVFVLGFHTYHQYKNFNEFKDLVEKLVRVGVEFMTLRESFVVLKNGKI